MSAPRPHPFPVARWVALAWLAFFVPFGWTVHGGWNLVFFCDVAVILTCVGIARGNPLLLSSQALSVLVVQSGWTIDLVVRLYGGSGLIPGPNWMLNPEIALLYRIVSLYHAVWPLLLLWCLARLGYDRRAFGIAALLAAVLVAAGRLAPAAMNVNCAHDLLGRSWQPGWLHVVIVVGALTVLVYGPTHIVLHLVFREAARPAWQRETIS